MKSIRERLAKKLYVCNDKVGAELIKAGFKIKKTAKREACFNETVVETDSIKCLIVAEVFET